jgi:uncharacterized protein (TIGR02246 family)
MDSTSKHPVLSMFCIKAALLAGLLLPAVSYPAPTPDAVGDTEALTNMVIQREHAMQAKDATLAMQQFSDDATWINSQGYYFEGKSAVAKFHNLLTQDPQRDYHYEAGSPRIRLLDSSNAVVYYSWKMTWFERDKPEKIINPEVGLMTLTAQKRDGKWYWVAITVQHTPWFYQSIEPEPIGE